MFGVALSTMPLFGRLLECPKTSTKKTAEGLLFGDGHVLWMLDVRGDANNWRENSLKARVDEVSKGHSLWLRISALVALYHAFGSILYQVLILTQVKFPKWLYAGGFARSSTGRSKLHPAHPNMHAFPMSKIPSPNSSGWGVLVMRVSHKTTHFLHVFVL